VDGYHRRFSRGPTHAWISAADAAPPHTLDFRWDHPVRFSRVELTFDNLPARRADNPWEAGRRVFPGLVHAYDLHIRQDGEWVPVASVRDNIHRFVVHRLKEVASSRLRLTVHGTHDGGGSARVYQVAVRCA